MDASSLSISPSELASLIGGTAAPVILDVRKPQRFADSPLIIAGSVYCSPEELRRIAAATPDRDVIVYCVHGHEVSQVAAAMLRAAGWNARYLEGGIEGGEDGVDAAQDIKRWRAHPAPCVPKDAGPYGATA